MTTESDNDTIEMEREELEQLIDERVKERLAAGQTGRRELLKAGGALGLGGLLGGAAVSGSADQAAAADTSQPDIGTSATPVDAYLGWAELADAAKDPADAGEMARNGTDVKVHSGGSVRNLSKIGTGAGAFIIDSDSDSYGEIPDAAADPTTNGEIGRNGTDVKVYSGGGVRNLSDIASGLDIVSSTSASQGFDTWVTPSSSNLTLVEVSVLAQTDGSSRGRVRVRVDESGGTNQDYSFTVAYADPGLGNGGGSRNSGTFLLPKGASYQINNPDDPNNSNTILAAREVVLGSGSGSSSSGSLAGVVEYSPSETTYSSLQNALDHAADNGIKSVKIYDQIDETVEFRDTTNGSMRGTLLEGRGSGQAPSVGLSNTSGGVTATIRRGGCVIKQCNLNNQSGTGNCVEVLPRSNGSTQFQKHIVNSSIYQAAQNGIYVESAETIIRGNHFGPGGNFGGDDVFLASASNLCVVDSNTEITTITNNGTNNVLGDNS